MDNNKDGEDFDSDSQNQNKSKAIELNYMENLELENLSENQQLSNSQISNQQYNNQMKKLILQINLILSLSYSVQLTLGMFLVSALAMRWQCANIYENDENESNENQSDENQSNAFSFFQYTKIIIVSLIIIVLLVLTAVRLLKFFWKYQIFLAIIVSILLILFYASFWMLLAYNFFIPYCEWFSSENRSSYYKLQQLWEIKISLTHLYFYFNFQLGIILLQTHITYQMSTNKQINLIFKNFVVSILCGCSVIFLPSYAITLLTYNVISSFSDLNERTQWRWEGFLINPIVFSIYTFLYIRSVKQIQNGKFQLRDDQKYIGAVLTFINMFI